jgi:SsrA-binding protein
MAPKTAPKKASSNRPEERRKVVATNRKARHDY